MPATATVNCAAPPAGAPAPAISKCGWLIGLRISPVVSEFPDWSPSPNIRDHPDIYQLENEAFDPDGLVLDQMRRLAPWLGRHLVDLGCGTGFWLPGYAAEAATVTGVEPDPTLAVRARERVESVPNARVLAGSAEHLPLPDGSVDVMHARFAYFFGAGAEAGLAEVMRVLRPGGALVVVDNDRDSGEFAELLTAAGTGNGAVDGAATRAWWARAGASRSTVASQWRFARRADFEAVLGIEFPAEVAADWLRRHPDRLGLSYGYALYRARRTATGAK